MNGISAPESSLAFLPLPCEDSVRRQMSMKQDVGSACFTEPVSALILDFLTSRTVRKKCVSFKPPSLCYFCYSTLNGLRWIKISVFLVVWFDQNSLPPLLSASQYVTGSVI